MNIKSVTPMELFSQSASIGEIIPLPQVNLKGEMSLEESIVKRRSIREFSSKPLTIEQIGQLLWAAQGTTEKHSGLRSVPSAGALYPMVIYVILPSGIYHYNSEQHELKCIKEGDRRLEMQKAVLDQEAIGSAPAVFVFAAIYEKTAGKYGARASRYVHIEAGHVCQNMLLQATAQGLASVPVGAFDDQGVAEVVKMAKNESPLYLVPVGFRVE